MKKTKTTMEKDIYKEFISEKDTSLMLGVSVATLKSWRHKKVGPNFYKIGGLVRYTDEDIKKWINENYIDLKSGTRSKKAPK